MKKDSRSVIREIREADILVKMITGDNILTAAHVAQELRFLPGSDKERILFGKVVDDEFIWEDYNQKCVLSDNAAFTSENLEKYARKWLLCLDGKTLSWM